MEFGFTPDQETLRASVREVLAQRSTSTSIRSAAESDDGIDRALWKTVGELGWTGVAIEESFGGLGLGLLELSIICEEMGRAIAPVPFFSTVVLAGQILEQVKPSVIRDGLLAGIADGSIIATAFGTRGPVSVTAIKTADGFTLTGDAGLAPDAHLADQLIVPASLEGRTALFVVGARSLPARLTPLESLDGARRLSRLRLDTLSIPADACIDADGQDSLDRGIDRVAVALSAEGVGVSQEVLERTVAHASERTQFDKPIGSFQAISHRCADMMLFTETARSHVFYAAWALEEGATDARLAAASAKTAMTDACRFVSNGGIQIHGGIGFTYEHDMHLFYRRAKFCELFLGDGDVWRERVTEALVQ